jgi:trans-L-3-hydroxyproline dehydratase
MCPSPVNAFIDAQSPGLSMQPVAFAELVAKVMALKRAVTARRTILHPLERPELSVQHHLYRTAPQRGRHSSNLCIFAKGEVDRCPTATGVSARLALHYARGEIGLGQPITIERALSAAVSPAA